MKNATKVTLMILGVSATFMLIVYIFLSAVHSNVPKELEYPQSGLSQSIFDSQNMNYVANASLTGQYSYEQCPYTLDTVTSEAAKLGENGVIYKVSDDFYIYTTEYPAERLAADVVKNELCSAILIDSDPANAAIDNYVYDEGYKNGFKIKYRIDSLTVSNASATNTMFITGYDLAITDSDLYHGYNMYLAVVTRKASTESFEKAKTVLDTVLSTYQYNKEVQEKLSYAESKAEKEALRNGTSTAQTEESSDSTTSTSPTAETEISSDDEVATVDETTVEDTTETDDGVPKKAVKTVNLDKEYSNVTLHYYYSNVNEQISLTLYGPEKTVSFKPSSVENGTAVFEIDIMQAGVWTIEIEGNAGADSMKLITESNAE